MRDLKQKLITGLVALFVAALAAVFVSPSYREGEPSIHGRPAKDFAFTVDGKPMHLSDFRGHVVVLNFWASWCGPCVDEAPSLNQLQQRISALGGTVLGVDPDVNGEDQASYEKFLKDNQITFPTYLDTSQQIAASYGTSMYPETYIISPDGKLDRKIVGQQDWTSPEMVRYLASLMPKKQTTQESSLLP
jgi:cytochrome c biogenesis protein CcmG, thiol:disulfide interchange protein DsbE